MIILLVSLGQDGTSGLRYSKVERYYSATRSQLDFEPYHLDYATRGIVVGLWPAGGWNSQPLPLVGLEQPPNITGKTRERQTDIAPDSAFSADLQRIIDAWPHLSDRTRQTILELVNGATDAPGNAPDAPGSDAEG